MVTPLPILILILIHLTKITIKKRKGREGEGEGEGEGESKIRERNFSTQRSKTTPPKPETLEIKIETSPPFLLPQPNLSPQKKGKKKKKTHSDIKVIIPEIPAGVRSLDNHLLALHGAARKSELVASAAPVRLVRARDVYGGPAVCHRLVDRPGALVGAHEGVAAAVAPRAGVPAVVEGLVVLVARLDRVCVVALSGPGATWFAFYFILLLIFVSSK